MIKSYFLLVLKSIVRRRLRSWLTVLGIFIGIAAVVALISVSQGLQDAIVGQFQSMGTDKVLIMPGGGGGLKNRIHGLIAQEKKRDSRLKKATKSNGDGHGNLEEKKKPEEVIPLDDVDFKDF